MQTKWQCVSIFVGLFLWATTIFIGIFYQQEILKWVSITPFHMIFVYMLILFLCMYLVVSIQGLRYCEETKKCKHAFRGLSHSRMKKGK